MDPEQPPAQRHWGWPPLLPQGQAPTPAPQQPPGSRDPEGLPRAEPAALARRHCPTPAHAQGTGLERCSASCSLHRLRLAPSAAAPRLLPGVGAARQPQGSCLRRGNCLCGPDAGDRRHLRSKELPPDRQSLRLKARAASTSGAGQHETSPAKGAQGGETAPAWFCPATMIQAAPRQDEGVGEGELPGN